MKIQILGIPVDCLTMDNAVSIADTFMQTNHTHSILAVNPEKIIAAGQNSEIFRALHNASLCIPDGIGVVLAARLWGAKAISRVPGSELMPRLCELAAKKKYPVYLFGGSEAVNTQARNVLERSYPGLIIAGRDNGYVPESQYLAVVDRINTSGARILFVALGSPLQENWIETYRDRLVGVRICQGVGGTLDVISGNVARAPSIFRKLNLEWAYRLITQPSRFKRQTALPIFALRAFKERMQGKKSVIDI